MLELWGDRGDPKLPTRKILQIPDRTEIELVWIEGASHFLTLERPNAIAAAIDAFVRRNSPPIEDE